MRTSDGKRSRSAVPTRARTARPTRRSASPGPLTNSKALLPLTSGAGNAAMTRLLSRDATAPAMGPERYMVWSRDEIKAIQRQLRRLRLYRLGIDGKLGRMTDQGLVEAFGGDEWKALAPDTAVERLRAAQRPRAGRGHDLRYGELFKDGLLDLTFGYGYMEELSAQDWETYSADVEQALTSRGYTENAELAASLYAGAGRSPGTFGRFFVKPHALTYSPPAGEARPIPAIVRFITNPSGTQGAEAAAAFQEGMTAGDAAYYSGHGRYGTGPDFDRNFASFTLKDDQGNVEQVIDDYEVLERVLRQERRGGAWSRFQQRHRDGTLVVDFTNAGNLRMNPNTLHPHEFGGRLINWAMQQTGNDPVTGPGGALAQAAAQNPQREYRILVFDGCRTRDYVRAVRGTPGFDPHSTDIISTRRTVGFGAESEALVSFLDSLVDQQSGEEIVRGMNQEMRRHEGGYSGTAFTADGLQGNPTR